MADMTVVEETGLYKITRPSSGEFLIFLIKHHDDFLTFSQSFRQQKKINTGKSILMSKLMNLLAAREYRLIKVEYAGNQIAELDSRNFGNWIEKI